MLEVEKLVEETEKIKMKIQKKCYSEFRLENPDESVITKFAIDDNAREALCTVFSPELWTHDNVFNIREQDMI